MVAPDGKETLFRDLKEAVRSATHHEDLRIILRGNKAEPFRVESAEALEILAGSVTIGGDPAAGVVLIVAMTGADPFLRVGPRGILKLDNLAIQVEYEGKGRKAVPPLIASDGALFLSRCALWTTDPSPISRAVGSEGTRFLATGCWFGGFRQCLDIGIFAGTEVLLEQCMLIRNPDADPAGGWVIRVRHETTHGSDRPRAVALRRCTVSDACLLRADDFSPSSPLSVSIEGSAVQAGALLTWKTESALARENLRWSGRDNLYDLSRAAWVVLLEGTPTGPEGLIDTDVWTRMTEDRTSRIKAIPFPKSARETGHPPDPSPQSFPVQQESAVSVGADPRLVGPVNLDPVP